MNDATNRPSVDMPRGRYTVLIDKENDRMEIVHEDFIAPPPLKRKQTTLDDGLVVFTAIVTLAAFAALICLLTVMIMAGQIHLPRI